MTALQIEALYTAQALANELRLTVAHLLTLPMPDADYAANAMRGAEMVSDALAAIRLDWLEDKPGLHAAEFIKDGRP
jgi:hypothetical protein